jgi:hypothetical protein
MRPLAVPAQPNQVLQQKIARNVIRTAAPSTIQASATSTAKSVGQILSDVGANYTSTIKSSATRYGVPPQNIFNIAMDLESEQIEKIRTTHRRTFKDDYLKQCAYTSCVASAGHIFGLVAGNPKSNGSGDYHQFANVVQGEKGNNVTIHCAIGGADHGFVIVIQGSDAEIIQSFAGASGAKLIDSFEGGAERRTFAIDGLVALLNTMDQKLSQKQLFGGFVDAGKTLVWQVAELKSEEEIQELAEKRLEQGLTALK